MHSTLIAGERLQWIWRQERFRTLVLLAFVVQVRSFSTKGRKGCAEGGPEAFFVLEFRSCDSRGEASVWSLIGGTIKRVKFPNHVHPQTREVGDHSVFSRNHSGFTNGTCPGGHRVRSASHSCLLTGARIDECTGVHVQCIWEHQLWHNSRRPLHPSQVSGMVLKSSVFARGASGSVVGVAKCVLATCAVPAMTNVHPVSYGPHQLSLLKVTCMGESYHGQQQISLAKWLDTVVDVSVSNASHLTVSLREVPQRHTCQFPLSL